MHIQVDLKESPSIEPHYRTVHAATEANDEDDSIIAEETRWQNGTNAELSPFMTAPPALPTDEGNRSLAISTSKNQQQMFRK